MNKNAAIKSSQRQIKEKIVDVTSAGTINGSMMRPNTLNGLHPSMAAASSRSFGIPRINCMSKKMKNACPQKYGTIRGRKVPTQPNLEYSRNCGTMTTWNGSMSVIIMHPNQKFEPGNRIRANPNAITAEENTAPSVAVSYTHLDVYKRQPQRRPL